ncbi:hypothetical protein [Akkermansia muciniphila]|uniref:hypothetical protein n=1 Tax=Akkermansia muciniphila TaxID=239935 RepID=UPI000BDF9CF3|nr:hypothetical protein [Akkermansia muciniphila]
MSSKALAQTQDKALQLNLASTIYGTFAEIGAGQETANWFFRASGAAGTVAKTISAYDMTVSDTLYGPVKRYVSEERLKGMLDYEFTQLVNRLGPQRGKDTRFFAFCNTVKVKGYRDNGPWHGWIGVRFQLKPEAKPSDLIIHVRLNDPDHDRQMKDLGILGVNILHAVFFKRDRLEEFIESLVDNLDPRLVEIDVVRFEGHGFSMVDNRLAAPSARPVRPDAGHPVPGERPGGPGGGCAVQAPHRADEGQFQPRLQSASGSHGPGEKNLPLPHQ